MKTVESWRFPSHRDSGTGAVVLAEVAKAFGFSTDDLRTRDRHMRIAWARQVAMTLMAEECGMTLCDVGRALDRDHGTVIHARRAVSNLTSTSISLREEIDGIRKAVRKAIEDEHYP